MPRKDITGHVTDRMVKRVAALRQRMRERIPYGPLREGLTSKEARLRLQNIDPETKLRVMQRMGDAEWQHMMDTLYDNT